MIVLTLPYAVSANVYWRTAARGGRAMTYVSAEAKKYRADVARICAERGIRQPLQGRLSMHLRLFPHRPLDWKKRQRKLGALWADTVQCIDLGNAEKVLADALQGIVYEDDKMLWRLQSERMEPDEYGARVIVAITQLAVPAVQGDLLAPSSALPVRTSTDAPARDTAHARPLGGEQDCPGATAAQPLLAPAIP